MDFGFSEEQELLRSEVRKFLDANCPMEEVRRLAESPEGFSRELWKRMAELGWLGLLIPEDHGGAGLGWVDLVVVLEEMGRSLFPSPYLAHTLVAATLREAASPEQRRRWLPLLARGERIASVALLEASDWIDPRGIQARGEPDGDGVLLQGEKLFVLDGAVADWILVAFREGDDPEAISLGMLEREAPGVEVETLPGIDPTKRMARVRLAGARLAGPDRVGAPRAAWAQVERLFDFGAAAVTAEAIGAAEAALALTVGYAREREQFGSPIGRFQGVKHPLAEHHVAIECFKSLLYFAAWALEEEPASAPRAVSMAKAYASEAFARLGIDTVQLHGAIGYTWEYDAQLYLKRSKWVRAVFGGSDHHYDRVAALGGLEWTST